MFTFLAGKVSVPSRLDPELYCLLLNICFYVTAWPHDSTGDNCPSAEWSVMCRPCCEYHLIQCRCPSKGSRVGYTVPCCRNALGQCDPCIIHPGCSLFENCKTCHNGTWRANDDFFVNGKYCTECRQGWSGGDCKTCGGVIQRAQGHIALESYPTNARCEWTVQVQRGRTIELRFSLLSLESDHNCRYDYVEARDGDGLSSPVIGRFCGDRLPPPVRTSGNLLHILFTSDGYNNLDGFVLTFHESSGWFFPTAPVSSSVACQPAEPLLNGYLMPAYGLEDELVSVKYGCHQPFVLTGSQLRTCLPNGTWSGTPPTCVKGQTNRVQCAAPPKLLHGSHRLVPGAPGGDAAIEFSCKNSYILSGSHRSRCLSNGSWSSRPPECVRACREPRVSELVRQRVVKPQLPSRQNPKQTHLSSRHSLHDLLTPGFTPLTVDRQSGVGRDDLPRGFHSVHTIIEYRCASPLYRHKGSPRRTCLKTGRWSGRHVSCSPVCGKLDTFSSHNLSDTQWPWHAAIYVRSPPDPTAGGVGSRGVTASHQQEPTQGSALWFLACSGALLAQRSVLVAAQCAADKDTRQPLQPARVKVVIGRKYQALMDRSNGQHHLRVSEILINPEFDSAPESGVAVLKLKDKAKISERVLPVCLPRMQGGEMAAQEAYTARWILPNGGRHLSHRSALSQTQTVELSDVTRCEKALSQGGTHTAAISDNTLCVARKPSSPESPCPSVIPGLTILPAGVSSTPRVPLGQEQTHWQLLALESFIRKENHCHQQTYTVQTRVGNFRDWIEKHMG